MSWIYAACLAVSTVCMVILDWRFRLAFWAAPRRTALVVAAGLVFFLLWDLVGIALGVFRHLDSEFASGILVAPQLPLEELMFLVFLCYLTTVASAGAAQLLRRGAGQ